MRPHLRSCDSFCVSDDKKGFEGLGRVQRRARELGKAPKHRSDEEQLGEVGKQLSAWRKGGSGETFLKGGCNQEEDVLFSKVKQYKWKPSQIVPREV